MVAMRRSPSAKANSQVKEAAPRRGEGNVAWLERHGNADGVVLLGGTSLADFRVRVAQSALRGDLLPSFWSLAGILLADGVFASVPLSTPDVSAVPPCNGVVMCRQADYDDPARWPNVAVIRFAKAHDQAVADINRVRADRSIIDLPTLMIPWLGFVWGVQGAGNPLGETRGLPSAAFVETVFAMSGFELTPGLSSASSCPEAMWAAAKWWGEYYEGAAAAAASEGALAMVPRGAFAIRQRAAAVVE